MMHRYAVYEMSDGAIVRTVALKFTGAVTAQDKASKAARQAREGQGVLELPPGFKGDDTTHRVAAGVLVPITGD